MFTASVAPAVPAAAVRRSPLRSFVIAGALPTSSTTPARLSSPRSLRAWSRASASHRRSSSAPLAAGPVVGRLRVGQHRAADRAWDGAASATLQTAVRGELIRAVRMHAVMSRAGTIVNSPRAIAPPWHLCLEQHGASAALIPALKDAGRVLPRALISRARPAAAVRPGASQGALRADPAHAVAQTLSGPRPNPGCLDRSGLPDWLKQQGKPRLTSLACDP